MGWRGTLILAILAAAAGGLYLLTPAPPEELPDATLLGEPRYRDPEAPVIPLIEFDPAQVEAMTLGFRDEVVSVARMGERWRGADDDRNLADFLAQLARAGRIAVVEEGELAEFGLAAPERRILLEMGQGKNMVLLLGDRTPAGTAAYVRTADGTVAIAGALLLWEFDKAFAAITGRKPQL